MSIIFVGSPLKSFACFKAVQHVDLNDPGLPITNIECLISKTSFNWRTFLMNFSSGYLPNFNNACLVYSCKDSSTFSGG